MTKRILLYACISIILLGLAVHGDASSAADRAKEMASSLSADFETIFDAVSPLSIDAEQAVVEARLLIDDSGNAVIASIRDSLPPAAVTAIVSDHCHGSRWLHITCPAAPDADSIHDTAYDILTLLEEYPIRDIRLFLNARWNTGGVYSPAGKTDIIQSIFDRVDARTVASMADGRMVSMSGLSSQITSCASNGQSQTNITASLCDTGQGTVLWVGVPVLTVEY